MKRLLWITLAVLGLLVAVSCQQGPAPAAEREIKLGIATPLSGPSAAWGTAHARALEMYLDEVNAAGGVEVAGAKYPIKIITYDHKYVIADAVAAVNKLLSDDKVKFISLLGGSVVMALEEQLREAGVMGLHLAYAEGVVHSRNPLQFSYFAMPPETTRAWPWVKEKYPAIQNVATLTPNDETGWWSIKISAKAAEAAGLKVVSREFFERPATDFVPTLLRMLASKPDIIDVTASPAGSVGLIVKQARELGYTGRFAHWGQVNMAVVAKTAGEAGTEGFLAHGYVDAEFLPPAAKDWVDKYLKKYGPPFDPTTLDFCCGGHALVAGLKAAGSREPAKVAEALRTARFDTPWGKARYGGKEVYGIGNQIVYELPISEYRGGKAVLVTTLPVFYKE